MAVDCYQVVDSAVSPASPRAVHGDWGCPVLKAAPAASPPVPDAARTTAPLDTNHCHPRPCTPGNYRSILSITFYKNM